VNVKSASVWQPCADKPTGARNPVRNSSSAVARATPPREQGRLFEETCGLFSRERCFLCHKKVKKFGGKKLGET
jgi:hypothetical protein